MSVLLTTDTNTTKLLKVFYVKAVTKVHIIHNQQGMLLFAANGPVCIGITAVVVPNLVVVLGNTAQNVLK